MVISSMHNVNVIVLSSYKVEYPMIETTTATVFTYIYKCLVYSYCMCPSMFSLVFEIGLISNLNLNVFASKNWKTSYN